MNYARILETYTLEEILEYNDIPPERVLEYISGTTDFDLKFPPLPIDYNEEQAS